MPHFGSTTTAGLRRLRTLSAGITAKNSTRLLPKHTHCHDSTRNQTVDHRERREDQATSLPGSPDISAAHAKREEKTRMERGLAGSSRELQQACISRWVQQCPRSFFCRCFFVFGCCVLFLF